jgi:hypothetical protein
MSYLRKIYIWTEHKLFPVAGLGMPQVPQKESADSSLGEGAVMARADSSSRAVLPAPIHHMFHGSRRW